MTVDTAGVMGTFVRAGARLGSGRLRRTARLASPPLVVAAIIIALYVGFGVSYLRDAQSLGGVERQVAQVQAVLARDPGELEGLEQELQSIQEELEAMRRVIVEPLSHTAVLDAVLAAAAESGVVVQSAAVSPPATEELRGSPFLAAPYSLKVEGSPGKVLDFLALLETGTLETLAVRTVSTTAAADGLVVAAVEFSVYSQLQPPSAEDAALPLETGGGRAREGR